MNDLLKSSTVAPLSQQALAEAISIANEAKNLFAAEEGATRARATLHRAAWQYVDSYGLASVKTHAESKSFTTTSNTLIYHIPAQFVLDINIFHKTSKEERAKRQTMVRPIAQVMEMLFLCREEHEGLHNDAWFTWYIEQGQQSGLIKRLTKLNSISDNVENREASPSPESVVDEAFDSANAVKLPETISVPALVPGKTLLVMVRQDEGGTTLLPLPNAGTSALAGVVGYQASGLENAPLPLVFWHQLITVGSGLVPDRLSDVPVNPLAEDDEVNASTDVLPSNAVYLLTRGKFSIASARRDDTRVVEMEPVEGIDLDLNMKSERFMDKATRNTMSERLTKPGICGGYTGEGGISVISAPKRVRVKFLHVKSELNGQLAFPARTEFRTNWTSRVSADFTPVADGSMDTGAVNNFERDFLAMMFGKRKDDVAITVKVADGAISFRRDKAKTASYAAISEGSAEVRVMQSELLAVLPILLSMERVGDVRWRLDPEGLLMVGIMTRAASVRVYIQTLEKGRETASRKLLERVKALPLDAKPEIGTLDAVAYTEAAAA